MDENDPRRELDKFTALLVEEFRQELEITIKSLMSAQGDIANAQLDVLHKRSVQRIKKWSFDFWAEINDLAPGDIPEQDVLKACRIVIASVDETIAHVREHIIACDKSIYGDPDDDQGPSAE